MSGPGVTASFSYDAVGRRSSKTINSATTSYLYDGANIAQELIGGSASANNLTGGVDRVVSRTDSTGTVTPVADALGSTIGLVNASGAIETSYSYEPFGKTTTDGAASSNTQKYTGREGDATGLYYYRARYYSPLLQRFISEDPIGLAGGINLYAYVGNDPINFTDPFGLDKRPKGPFSGEFEWLNGGGAGDGGYNIGARGGWPPPRRPFWDQGGRRWYEAQDGPGSKPGPPRVTGPDGPIDPSIDPYENTSRDVGPPPNLQDEGNRIRPPENFNPSNPSSPNPPYPRNGSGWDKTKWVGSKVLDLGGRILKMFDQGSSDVIIILTPRGVIQNELRRGRGYIGPEAYKDVEETPKLPDNRSNGVKSSETSLRGNVGPFE